MITHVIRLRTECTITKLKSYITSFFKNEIRDSRYIFIQLKLQTVNNNLITIGDTQVLDLKKNKDKRSYRHHIECEYKLHLSPSNDDKVNRIVFIYTEIPRKEYLRQIKLIK